jgi:hypothetical protein
MARKKGNGERDDLQRFVFENRAPQGSQKTGVRPEFAATGTATRMPQRLAVQDKTVK